MSENNDFIIRDINITADGVTYSDAIKKYSYSLDTKRVEMFLNVKTVTGTTPTLDVVPQFSPDGENWFDSTAFAQATAATKEVIESVSKVGMSVRFKMTVGSSAADPDFTFDISAIAKV